MAARSRKGWWVLASFAPFGLGTWAGFAYAGGQAGVRRWKVYAVAYAVVSGGAFFVAATTGEDGDNAVQGFVILVPWIFGIGHSLVARAEYVRRLRPPASLGRIERAREQLATREEALRIAGEEPELARELGIGRPDRPGAMDAGLIDVNSAPARVIERLPSVNRALASRIVAVREQIDGFDSLEDLGMTLDLPGDVVEDLRDRCVFLPR